MKLKFKKITAWLMVLAIIMGIGLTALAEEENPTVANTEQTHNTQETPQDPGENTTQVIPQDTTSVEPQPTVTQQQEDPYSKAEYLVSTDIKVAPLPLDTPQTVNVTVNVKAVDSTAPIKNITLYLGDSDQPATEVFTQPITADNLEGINIIFPIYLNAAQFGSDINVWAEYTYDVVDQAPGTLAEKVAAKHLAGTVRVDVAANRYDFKLTPDATIVREGSTLGFTATFTNNSGQTVPADSFITFVGAYENGIQENIQPIDISGIAAGQSATFNFECANIVGALTVTPSLVIGQETLPQEPVSIILKNASAQVILEIIGPMGVPLNGKVTIKYSVINTGNVPLKNIKVYDDNYQDRPFPVTSLEPGQSMDASTRVQITENTEIRYKIIAEDSYNDQLRVSSNSVKVMLVTSVDDIVLSIKATVKGSSIITEPKEVPFDVTVTNNSGVTVSNLKIYDANGAEVWSIYSLGSNKSETFTVPFEITSSQNVTFKVAAADQNGQTVEFESNLVPVTLDGTTPKPSESAQPTQAVTIPPTQVPTAQNTEEPQETDNTQLMIILLSAVGGLVVVVGIVALIIISSLQRRAARKKRKITRRVR